MSTRCVVNGVRILFQDTGDGEPLVLVHGSWGSYHKGRGGPRAAEHCRAVSYDRRGHSESERVAGQGTFAEDVADLAALVEALDAAPAWVVLDLIRAGDHAGAAKRFVDDVAFGPGARARLPEQMRATMADNAPTYLDEELAPDSRTVDEAALARYEGPVLVTSDGQSPPVFRQVVQRLARLLPQAHRVEYAGAGHVPHVTHPEAFVNEVRAFTSRINRLTSSGAPR